MTSRRKYNLDDLYGNEGSLKRYTRLTVGDNGGVWALIGHEIMLGLFGSLPGVLGLYLRSKLYPYAFKRFHRKSVIGRATLRCPRQIQLDRNVIIDDFVQLIANSRMQPSIYIGEKTFVRSYAMLNAGPPDGFIRIGSNSTIGQSALLYGNGGLTIGNKVMIAGHSSIIASSHCYDDPNVPMIDQGYTATGITICDNVWIGAGARILDGVTIGEGAIVGANAVVNRSVAPGEHVGGVPARVLNK